ncbi:MAG: proline--tRNA ligase [Fibrobacterota bacterium]
MRFSSLYCFTEKEIPAEAEIVSHKLMLKAGFIKKHTSGLYSFTPLMNRVIKKISNIVEDEMDKSGAQQVLMPILQPSELWQESGRLPGYKASGIMFTLNDRKESELCLGPTHEEMIVDMVRNSLKSYKDLPVILYQQNTKFRDEIRPRFGLMRCREFIMKDAYSFDSDETGLDRNYKLMSGTYEKIFTRCGLDFVKVDADPGAIGGSGSQEFMVTAESGEDEIIACPSCGYGANVEKAESVPAPVQPATDKSGGPEEHDTPGIKTVTELCNFFSMLPGQMVKTIIYRLIFEDREGYAAVLMRGDCDVNDVKLVNKFGCLAAELADDEAVKRITGAEVGFAGPLGLDRDKVTVIADQSIEGLKNFLCGCNKTDKHCLNVNISDFPKTESADLRKAAEGESCIRCGKKLNVVRGIEVGHIFKLGTKYSSRMKACFTAEDGKQKPFIMGCYGIGTSRIAAAAIEQNHDNDGMIWPLSIAPYHLCIIPVNISDPVIMELAEKIYSECMKIGIETVIDDRDARAGFKFKDADLIGFPFTITAGRDSKDGKVEFKIRSVKDKSLITPDEAITRIKENLGIA